MQYDIAVDSNQSVFLFALASAIGGLVIFLAYAELGAYLVRRIQQMTRLANRLLSAAFLILAAIIAVRFLNSS